MSDSGFPSMTALLGLLAVAGYQNRDKIGEWIGGLQGGGSGMNPSGALPSGTGAPTGAGYPQQQSQGHPQASGGYGQASGSQGSGSPIENILAGLRGQHSDANSFLGGAVGNLVDKFRQAGHGQVADSWVASGPNREITAPDLESAIGSDTLSTLQQRTGLSRDEILARLSRELPGAVDRYTPDGRLPNPA